MCLPLGVDGDGNGFVSWGSGREEDEHGGVVAGCCFRGFKNVEFWGECEDHGCCGCQAVVSGGGEGRADEGGRAGRGWGGVGGGVVEHGEGVEGGEMVSGGGAGFCGVESDIARG